MRLICDCLKLSCELGKLFSFLEKKENRKEEKGRNGKLVKMWSKLDLALSWKGVILQRG